MQHRKTETGGMRDAKEDGPGGASGSFQARSEQLGEVLLFYDTVGLIFHLMQDTNPHSGITTPCRQDK